MVCTDQVSSSVFWIVHREHKRVFLSSQRQSGGAIHNVVVFKIGGAASVDKFSLGAVVSRGDDPCKLPPTIDALNLHIL